MTSKFGAHVLRIEMSLVKKKNMMNKHVNIFENLGETYKFLEILFIYILIIGTLII